MILKTVFSNKAKIYAINKIFRLPKDFRLPLDPVVNIELCNIQEMFELFKTMTKNMTELTQIPVELWQPKWF